MIVAGSSCSTQLLSLLYKKFNLYFLITLLRIEFFDF
jgi:hypothetical protein